MNIKHQRLCVWAAAVFLVGFTIGFAILARFIPPIAPALGAEEVKEIFLKNLWQIRLGLLITLQCIGFGVPLAAAISEQIKRIEKGGTVLANTQLVVNAIGVALVILPVLIWLTIAFRPERDAEMFLLLNDFAWLAFTIPATMLLVQCLTIAVATFADKSESPVFDRWVAYFNIWAGFLFLPSGLAVFFKTGPFAWDGLISFWMAILVFSAWYSVMIFVTLKAIKRQELTET